MAGMLDNDVHYDSVLVSALALAFLAVEVVVVEEDALWSVYSSLLLMMVVDRLVMIPIRHQAENDHVVTCGLQK